MSSFQNDIMSEFDKGITEIETARKKQEPTTSSSNKLVSEDKKSISDLFDAGVKEIEQSQAKEKPSAFPVEYGKGIVSGVRHRLPEMIGQAGQALGIEKAGELTKWAREGEKPTEHGVFYQAGEMTPASAAIPLALGTAAKGVAMLPIPGARPVAAGLQAAAWSIPAIMFGLSQLQSTREEAKKRGVEPGAAPYITGGIETIGETGANYALTKMLGPLAPGIPIAKAAVKTLLKSTLWRVGKELALKTIPTEVLTEMGQNWGEALTEKAYGIRPEAKPTKEAISAILPTIIMTLVGGGAATGIQRYQANKVLKILQDPEEDIKKRQNAANVVTGIILSQEENKDKPMAKAWFAYANNQISKGASIDTETSVGEKTKFLDNIIKDYESGEQSLDQSLNLIKEGYRNQLFNDDDLDKLSKEKPDLKDKIETVRIAANTDIIKDKLSWVINEGLTTGVFDGHVFRKEDAVSLIYKGLTDNIFTTDDLEEFKESHSDLRSDLNVLIATQIEKKVQQAFSPELAQTIEMKALPLGQGFELVKPKPKVKIKKAPPTYPKGAEYVAGKPAPKELPVEHKPILRKTVKGEMSWKTMAGAENAIKSKKLNDKGISPATHKVVEAPGGGYQIVRLADKGIAQKAEKQKKNNTLLAWIRAMGGIGDKTLPGEVRALHSKESGIVGLTSANGLSFDEIANLAVDEGWISKPEDFNEALRNDIFAQKKGGQRVEKIVDIENRVDREEQWKEFERAENDELEYFAKHPAEEVRANLDQWQGEAIQEIRKRDEKRTQEIEESTRSEVENENPELEGLKKDEGFSEYIKGWDEKEALDEETLAELEAWRTEQSAEEKIVEPEKKAKEPIAKVSEKQPWEMTKDEWTRRQGKLVSGQSAQKTIRLARLLHRDHLKIWLSEGKLTPKKYAELHEKNYGPLAEFMPEVAEKPKPKIVPKEEKQSWKTSTLATKPNISDSYIQAKKQADGKYKLFFTGTTNEVFQGETFASASEARTFFKVQQIKAREAIKPEHEKPVAEVPEKEPWQMALADVYAIRDSFILPIRKAEKKLEKLERRSTSKDPMISLKHIEQVNAQKKLIENLNKEKEKYLIGPVSHKRIIREALESGKLTSEKYAELHEKDYGPLEKFMLGIAGKTKAERVTKDHISAILSSKKKAGVKYEMEVRIAETGEAATVTKDAGVALRETKKELDKYNKFMECLT